MRMSVLTVFVALVSSTGCGSSAGGAGGGAGGYYAPTDAGPTAAVCGNGSCESGESTASCPADCPKPAGSSADVVATGAACGDGTCDSGESNASCPADCPKAVAAGLGILAGSWDVSFSGSEYASAKATVAGMVADVEVADKKEGNFIDYDGQDYPFDPGTHCQILHFRHVLHIEFASDGTSGLGAIKAQWQIAPACLMPKYVALTTELETSLQFTRTAVMASEFGPLGGTWSVKYAEHSGNNNCLFTVAGANISGCSNFFYPFTAKAGGSLVSGSFGSGYEFSMQKK